MFHFLLESDRSLSSDIDMAVVMFILPDKETYAGGLEAEREMVDGRRRTETQIWFPRNGLLMASATTARLTFDNAQMLDVKNRNST